MNAKSILIITAIAVLGLTIALYNVTITEWTSMIQLSLVVTCISELVIICTMGLLPELNYHNGSTGIMINIYAGLMIFWSIIGCNFEGNTYPIGLLLISAVMAVIIGMSVMGSHESDRINDEVEKTIENKRSFTNRPAIIQKNSSLGNNQENLASMWLSIQSTVKDIDTKRRLRVLVERIQALPANRFPNVVIDSTMKQITAMCRALTNSNAHDQLLTRIEEKTKELTNYIKNL